VSLNGKKFHSHTTLKLGSIEMISHRRVIINTPVMIIQISNSDNFLNQDTTLLDVTL